VALRSFVSFTSKRKNILKSVFNDYFLCTFHARKVPKVLFFILPQFKNGWTFPRSLADRKVFILSYFIIMYSWTLGFAPLPNHLTLTSSVQLSFFTNGALILLITLFHFQIKSPMLNHSRFKNDIIFEQPVPLTSGKCQLFEEKE